MRKLFAPFVFVLFAFSFYGFTIHDHVEHEDRKSAVKWYTWEEAVEANKVEKRKFFLDVYTDWCGWCKRLDETTFQNREVARYLNKNFYPVKMDAEMKKDIVFNNHTFSYVKSGRGGMHMLAYTLLEGQMTFPNMVYLTDDFERILISPGYKEPDDLLVELEYAKEEHYKTSSWETFRFNVSAGE